MGNTCTNCSACKGDMAEPEVFTVDNKVSQRQPFINKLTSRFDIVRRIETIRGTNCKCKTID